LASLKLGHADIARKWFDVSAKYKTTFYGQMAAQQTGQKPIYQFPDVSPSSAIQSRPAAQAAKWLAKNGHDSETTMFINALIDESKTPEDFAGVAALAQSLSLPRLSIKAAQESEKKTGVVLGRYAFPKIDRYLTGNDMVEWALVHALIRQESRYDPAAISSAGARGLMQLMPATAKEVARKAGIAHSKEWLITKPSHNIALGTRYLRQMLARYDGSYVPAPGVLIDGLMNWEIRANPEPTLFNGLKPSRFMKHEIMCNA
jgi:soluble lytic murein transglycosylase